MADALRAVGLGPGSGRSRKAWRPGSAPGATSSPGASASASRSRGPGRPRPGVLLDEPTAHLGEAEAQDLIADLKAALADKAVVLVTHDERLEARADAMVHLSGKAAPAPVS